MKSVGIIGAGIGGLSAAIHLASKGFKVTVFEKNSLPGGKASSLSHQGFRFDTGPSLLTMVDVVEKLFNVSGENISDYLDVKRLDVLCKYFYPDGTQLNAYSDFILADGYIAVLIRHDQPGGESGGGEAQQRDQGQKQGNQSFHLLHLIFLVCFSYLLTPRVTAAATSPM